MSSSTSAAADAPADLVAIHRSGLVSNLARATRHATSLKQATSEFRKRILEGQLVESIGSLARQAELSLHGLRQRELHGCYYGDGQDVLEE